jgi:Abortive infection alpha
VGFPLDPRGLLGVASGLAQFWLRTTIQTEQQLLGLLQNRPDDPDTVRPLPAGPETRPPYSLSSKMRVLLDRALDQSTSGSQEELFHHILDQLVADEARIIGALSDGSASPAVNVYDWTRRRTPGRAVLENASLIGRSANVALPQMVPTYVSHLLSLGLVQLGPEDADLKGDYEILTAETPVLKAIADASRGPLAARVDKHTLTLSPLGHALWAATMQQERQQDRR